MQNYHKHSWFSNCCVIDCATAPEKYIQRNVEVGSQVVSTVEHGFQSNYYVYYDSVVDFNQKLKARLDIGDITEEQYNKQKQKFVFGAEAYWVKDRQKEYPYTVTDKKGNTETKYRKDRANCHIILLARNEQGRREINSILSEANITGYYGQARVDLELLEQLKPEDVMVTTACVKYWQYEDIDDITMKLWKHFGDSFYLETQCHNTDRQKDINKHIKELHYKYGIKWIVGLDSHYIYESDSVERDNYLEGRGFTYDEDEVGWYMDYPDRETAKQRLIEQGVFNEAEIDEMLDASDIILTFDDITFGKDIKLPTLYPGKSQEWKDNKLKSIIYDAWDKEKQHVDPSRWKEYEDGIQYELNAVINTHMSDYFLLDYELVKRGKEYGGVITKTGRGSAVSYYINSLLGFSSVDRFTSPVKLYPDRFLSEVRILKTRSLPD